MLESRDASATEALRGAVELQVEAHRPNWLDMVPDLWLDHAGLAWLQDAFRWWRFDAVAQLAFENMNYGPCAALSFVRTQKGGWHRVMRKHWCPAGHHVSCWNGPFHLGHRYPTFIT